MRRGRKPKPLALDKLDGGASHRRRNRHEPKPPASEAACPDWLRGDLLARAIWDEEAPRHITIGTLTVVDRLMFSVFCERAALYRRAVLRLRRAPKGGDLLLAETRSNGKQPRPEIAIAAGALKGLREIAASFGMTPTDRKGLEVALGAGAARGGDSTPAAPQQKGQAGTAIDIDEYLERRGRRRGRGAE